MAMKHFYHVTMHDIKSGPDEGTGQLGHGLRPRSFRGPRTKQSKKLWCIFAHNESITEIKRWSGILPYS